MKLKSLVLALLIFSTGSAHALSFGVLAGYRSDTPIFISGNPLVTNFSGSVPSSYQAGAFVGHTLIGPIELTLGMLYKARTTSMTATVMAVSSGLTLKDTLFDFPLRLNLSLPAGLYLTTGATYSSVQTSSCSGAFGNMPCPVGTFRDVDDVAALIGAGFKFVKFAGFSLAVEGVYDYGLRDQSGVSGVSGWARGIEANVVAK